MKTDVKTNVNIKSSVNVEPLYILDGKTVSAVTVHAIDPEAIAEVKVLKGMEATELFGNAASQGVVVVNTKENANLPVKVEMTPVKPAMADGLIFINGKESTKQQLNELPGEKIKTINVLKGENSLYKDNPKAKNGVIIITTK